MSGSAVTSALGRHPLARVFTLSRIRDYAGPHSFIRGVSYHHDEKVKSGSVSDGRWMATVRGSVPYVVELWVEQGEPMWSCTCPAAEEGAFCKHCVAVALSFDPVDDDGDAPVLQLVADVPASPVSEADRLADHVTSLPAERLIEIVLAQAGSDPDLRGELLAEAHRRGTEAH